MYILLRMSLKLLQLDKFDDYDYEGTKNKKCIYCIYVEQYDSSETNIWYSYVSLPVWIEKLLIIILFAVVTTLNDNNKKKVTDTSNLLLIFFSNTYTGFSVFLKQSNCHSLSVLVVTSYFLFNLMIND